MPQLSSGRRLIWKVLSSVVLSLTVAVAFLPAHAPSGNNEKQSFSATTASRYDSPVAAILAPTDDVPEIKASSERLTTGTPAGRDSAPLNGYNIRSPLFFAARFFSASFAGIASHPLYHMLDIPPPFA